MSCHAAPRVRHSPHSRGFSLVELSIVLVILGLLVGGVLGGRSLIRAAELRSVVIEYNQWITALNTFKDKYRALPGDMRNAQDFWGAAANCNWAANTPISTSKATCNGDGNGRVYWGGTTTTTQTGKEDYTFWQHLSNAGMIPGGYTAKYNAGRGVPGEGVPPLKVGSGAWTVAPSTNLGNVFNSYKPASHAFFLFNPYDGAMTYSGMGVLNPEETWNIDSKFDDGSPTGGNMAVHAHTTCAVKADGTSGNPVEADIDAKYNLSGTEKSCLIYLTFD